MSPKPSEHDDSSVNPVKALLSRNFINPQMIALIIILLLIVALIYFFGKILLSVFLAFGLSYLLNFPLSYLVNKGVKRWIALLIVFSCLAGFIAFFLLYVAPLLIVQIHNLINESPNIINYLKSKIFTIQQYFSNWISEVTVYQIFENIHQYILQNLDVRIDNILAVFQNVVTVVANLFLVPVLSFLLLLDYDNLKKTVIRYLPERRELATGVFSEFIGQLNNYVKGKTMELSIMTVLTFIGFSFFGLKYNLVLSIVIGVSVIIPFLGVIIVTIPLVLVAFFQFELTHDFFLVMLVFLILQSFDAYILVPWLFSKANNLRPFTIIVSIIVFGKLWGVLGIFLAIPLATLLKALGNAWLLNSELYKEVQEKEACKAAQATVSSHHKHMHWPGHHQNEESSENYDHSESYVEAYESDANQYYGTSPDNFEQAEIDEIKDLAQEEVIQDETIFSDLDSNQNDQVEVEQKVKEIVTEECEELKKKGKHDSNLSFVESKESEDITKKLEKLEHLHFDCQTKKDKCKLNSNSTVNSSNTFVSNSNITSKAINFSSNLSAILTTNSTKLQTSSGKKVIINGKEVEIPNNEFLNKSLKKSKPSLTKKSKNSKKSVTSKVSIAKPVNSSSNTVTQSETKTATIIKTNTNTKAESKSSFLDSCKRGLAKFFKFM